MKEGPNGRLQRFESGRPLASQVTAARLNAMVDAINARTPQPGAGTFMSQDATGFSYSAKRQAGTGGGVTPGFKLRGGVEAGVGGFYIEPSVVSGFTSPVVPVYSGTSLTEDPLITGGMAGVPRTVYLKITTTTESAAVPGVSDAYYISGATLNGDITITFTDESQRASINTSTGAITQHCVCSVPIGTATRNGTGEKYTVDQTLYGPLACVMCETGHLDIIGGVHITAG